MNNPPAGRCPAAAYSGRSRSKTERFGTVQSTFHSIGCFQLSSCSRSPSWCPLCAQLRRDTERAPHCTEHFSAFSVCASHTVTHDHIVFRCSIVWRKVEKVWNRCLPDGNPVLAKTRSGKLTCLARCLSHQPQNSQMPVMFTTQD